ncbi:hypothetical protein COLO4_28460 [Corchorus olitorius]|uniref:Uncharacterized protein n=1 Tax=Corchorus olitorius TaxID=93759 RepID=A0A1R3HKP5_9ROSI|nr:hypothetical protein COLO4_28460 [Corchorus olitorius]
MSQNEIYSQLNVPFSWELKPGVSKVTHEEKGSSIDIRHVRVNLPPPPRLSRSARFCVDELQAVLPPIMSQLEPPPPRSSAKKSSYDSKNDPFVAAYRKCTEWSVNGKLGSSDDNKNEACRAKSKRNMFTLSCKYSCTVSSDNVVRVSQCSKDKAKEEQKENKDRVDAKLTEKVDVKTN